MTIIFTLILVYLGIGTGYQVGINNFKPDFETAIKIITWPKFIFSSKK